MRHWHCIDTLDLAHITEREEEGGMAYTIPSPMMLLKYHFCSHFMFKLKNRVAGYMAMITSTAEAMALARQSIAPRAL
jgi:hypothetical protein